MKVKNLSIQSKEYTSNVYLLTGNWNALKDINTLIDVGRDSTILDVLESSSTGIGKRRVEQVILTHSHYDHASFLPIIKNTYNPMVFAASENLEGVDVILKGGEVLATADTELEVIYTPGHSSDSICLYCREEKALFAGDSPLIIRSKDSTYDKAFLDALEYISSKDIEIIYFGHGEPLSENCNHILQNSLTNAKLNNFL